MKVLVTGAGGFLGRHVVAALLRRGHEVRALVRPAQDSAKLPWADRVDLFRADLRHSRDLADAFAGVDALVHLAAGTSGDYESQFAASVVATERLLDAMAKSSTRRIVLASSVSVYDLDRVGRTLREDSPLASAPDVYTRDAYAVAKLWQERVVRRMCAANGWELTVLRPGYIWGGPDHVYVSGAAHSFGPLHLVIAPLNRVGLTYVENCADCFAAALENRAAVGETFNVADGDAPLNWRFMGEYLRRSRRRGVRVFVPYRLGMTTARLATLCSRAIFGRDAKLPSILVPCRFAARFKPMRFDLTKLHDVLGWRPPFTFAQAIERAFGTPEPSLQPAESRHAIEPAPAEVVNA